MCITNDIQEKWSHKLEGTRPELTIPEYLLSAATRLPVPGMRPVAGRFVPSAPRESSWYVLQAKQVVFN